MGRSSPIVLMGHNEFYLRYLGEGCIRSRFVCLFFKTEYFKIPACPESPFVDHAGLELTEVHL